MDKALSVARYAPLLARIAYSKRIRSLLGSAIVAHWPLDDTSGVTARDLGPNNYTAAYTSVTLANDTSKVGKPRPTFHTGGGINLGGIAGLMAAAPLDEGAVIITAKMNALANWGSASQDYLLKLGSASDTIRIYRTANALSITAQRSAQAESKAPYMWMWPTADVNLIMSWSLSGGFVKLYKNGLCDHDFAAATGVTKAFTMPLDVAKCRLFAMQGVPTTYSWRGWGNDVILLNRAITNAEALAISKICLPDLPTVTFIGDSIAQASNLKYPDFVFNDKNGGYYRCIRRAYAGAGILDGAFAAQVTAAASDNADIIIVELGTNDDNAGNMATLQATAEAQLAILKASNPRAALYWLNVLPRWTDVGGGTPVDKGNIRTAIAAACTAKGVTCWDTFTAPWIAAADTVDGLHPTYIGQTGTGHRKIADQILLLLP
jgi:lysophospholipase L1-like esterase